MAKKKQAGKLTQHSRPNPKYLGVKVQDGEKVTPGMILIRQRGTKFGAAEGVEVGRDHTLYATREGTVRYKVKMGKKHVSVVSS